MAGTTTYYGVTYPTSTDYVKDGATAIQTVATGFDSAVAIPTYNAQTGATYTFALTDVGKTVTASNASASTYTIPPTASVAWPTGTTLEITNLGAGVVTFAAGAGVTVTNTASTLAQYASAALIRTGLNAWTVTPRSGGPSGLTLINSTAFTTQSSVSINDVFSATYDNYLVQIATTGSTTTTGVDMRLRVGGVDNTSGNYNRSSIFQSSTTITGQIQSAQTSFNAVVNAVSTERAFAQMTVINPFATQFTGLINDQVENLSSGIVQYRRTYGTTVTTSYTGFTFYPGTGTITGKVSTYGYQI